MKAEELFFHHVVREGGIDEAAFDRLCGDHPDEVGELETLRDDFRRARRFLSMVEADRQAPAAAEVDRATERLSERQALAALSQRLEGPARFLARRGEGEVGVRWDPQLLREVELRAPADHADRDEDLELMRRARRLARLEHPAVPAVHELGLDTRGAVVFTTRRARGTRLRRWFAEERSRDPVAAGPRAVEALFSVAETLAFAHTRGVVHGGLAPDRILVGARGEVAVVGWDDPGRSSDFRSTGSGDTGERDVEALGEILLDVFGNAAPRELAAVGERASGRHPGRYPSADALAADLRAFLDGRVVSASRAGPLVALRKWAGRHRLAATSILLSIVVLCLALAFYWRSVTRDGQLAGDAREQAAVQGARALAEAAVADERSREIELSSAPLLAEILAAEAAGLWPATPARIPAMREWLAEAQVLENRLDEIRDRLEKVRARAAPLSPQARERELAEHPLRPQLQEARAKVERHERGLAAVPAEDAARLEIARARTGWAREAARELEERVARRRTYDYPGDPEAERKDRLWSSAASELRPFVEGIRAPGQDPMYTDSLPGVARRLEFALHLEQVERDSATRQAWDRAIASIGNAAGPYGGPDGGLDIAAQDGLVPLGPDPVSGLWEFWHVQSGERPDRAAAGGWDLKAETGIVLVLIPGGRFLQGAQAESEAASNYDPWADEDEGPVTEVELASFFLSKYEITQAQWRRVHGENPSHYTAGNLGAEWTSPVERIDRPSCESALFRLDLDFPTEAQWEYAARGGFAEYGRFGYLATLEELEGFENVMDEAFAAAVGGQPPVQPWNDGFAVHAPVGRFAPNPFGLHDVLGNVREWCRDGDGLYEQPPRAGDGLRTGGGDWFVVRGGSFLDEPHNVRSAVRRRMIADRRYYFVGCRPSRAVR